jgi:lysozyme
MTEPKRAAPKAGAAAAIAAAVAIAAPIAMHFEGLRTKPYRDPVGIPTVCYGETQRAMREYTPAECAVMLQARQARDYAPQVLQCVPELADDRRVNVFAASVDFAYNAGVRTFCRSSMARAFNAGRWADGCRAFGLYDKARVNRRLVVLRGLARRRAAETSLCLKEPN